MIEKYWEIINNEYFALALLSGMLVSILSAPLGVFLNLKKMSLMGDAISHSLLPGIAISFLFFGFSYISLIVGGLISGVLVILILSWFQRKSLFKEDGILALVYLTMSSLGIMIISRSETKVDIMHFLFGNILMIPWEWIYIMIGSLFFVIPVFYFIKESLQLVILDPEYAQFKKINVVWTKGFFYLLVMWVLILCFYSVGTLLAMGYLVIPTMLSKLFFKSIKQQILSSILWGWVMTFFGVLGSFIFDLPTGPCMICVGGLLFMFLYFIKSRNLKRSREFLTIIFLLIPLSMKAETNSSKEILFSFSLIQKMGQELSQEKNFEVLIDFKKSVHSYFLSPKDIEKIKQSKLFFYSGKGYENIDFEKLKKQYSAVKFVDLSAGAPVQIKNDPHLWLHPLNAIHYYEKIMLSLSMVFPDKKESLSKKYKQIKEEITSHYRQLEIEFKNIPLKKVIVSHAAFDYLGSAFNIEFYSPLGFNSVDASKPSDLLKIKSLVQKEPKIPLFKEINSNNFFIEKLARELNKEISGILYGDSFPQEDNNYFSYVKFMQLNLLAIKKSLR